MIPTGVAAGAAIAVLAGSLALAGWQGYRLGRASVEAEQAAALEAIETLRGAAAQAAADAVSKLRVEQRVIQQRVERETIERPVYRDCEHTDDGLRLVNAALAGESVGADADRGVVPTPDRAGRP